MGLDSTFLFLENKRNKDISLCREKGAVDIGYYRRCYVINELIVKDEKAEERLDPTSEDDYQLTLEFVDHLIKKTSTLLNGLIQEPETYYDLCQRDFIYICSGEFNSKDFFNDLGEMAELIRVLFEIKELHMEALVDGRVYYSFVR